MRQSDKAYLDSLEVELRAMHQPHLVCPCHELAHDEEESQRAFGEGDERQIKPRRTEHEQFMCGHIEGDF